MHFFIKLLSVMFFFAFLFSHEFFSETIILISKMMTGKDEGQQ